MGYRSDVFVGLAVTDFCILRSKVGKRDNSSAYIVDEWVIDDYTNTVTFIEDCMDTITNNDKFTIEEYGGEDYVWFHISGIKWYDSYDPISIFQDTLDQFEKTWGMIIIGEETDDIKSYGDPWDLEMQLNRYVDQPGSYYLTTKLSPEIQTDSLPPECGFPINWVRIGEK